MASESGAITQENRLLKIKTPKAQDYLLLQSFNLVESISELPRAECVVLHDEGKEGYDPTLLDPKDVLGQNVTVYVTTEDQTTRYFHGMVNVCSQMDRDRRFTYYKLEVVPKIWLLTQTVNSRIFQHETVPQILEKVLGDIPHELQLGTVDWKPRNYIVQYRESDFTFISRLMEEEGIFYYFKYTEDEHRMMICVDQQSHVEIPGKSEIDYRHKIEGDEFVATIYKMLIDYRLQAGKVTLRDHSFQKPKNNFEVSQPTRFKFGANDEVEKYHFPAVSTVKHDVIDKSQGERPNELQNMTDDIKRSVENKQQEIDSRHRVITGSSNVCILTAGHKFKLKNNPSRPLNGNYVLTSVRHNAVQSPMYDTDMPEGGYWNEFECIAWGESSSGEKAVPFRPARVTPKPMILTSQTATVVGPSGEEIYTDKFGRVKVQFHWDREGEFDPGSSCWARVSQNWAGNKWGGIFIPRIGMEVLVHFIEGDPDQPIITGCVYNNDSMPPYTLPDEKTKSGIKSDSSLGGGGFNEWRFEDKKGSEQIFIHGEKDLDVRIKNDRRELIGHDRHLIVKNDKHEKIERDSHIIIERDLIEKIERDYHRKVEGKIAFKTDGDFSHDIGGGKSEQVGANYAIDAGAFNVKAKTIVLEAETGLTIKVGGNFVSINAGGVQINGTAVLINSGGAALPVMPGSIVPPLDPEKAKVASDAVPGGKPTKPSQTHKPKKPENKDKKSWVKIKIVDEQGEAVKGERYRITLPDGSTVSEGTTDKNGMAAVTNVDPGNCKITFPNIDGRAWKKK